MITIRIHPDNHIEITGIPANCTVTTAPAADAEQVNMPLAPGLYRYKGDERLRVLALAEGTWFQIQRSSDGANDFFALPVPPKNCEIEVIPDHQATQEQLRLFELACHLAERGNEIWVCDDDHYYRTASGRAFRLLQSGAIRFQPVPEFPAGARLTLVSDPLLDELCDAADELDDMLEEPRRQLSGQWATSDRWGAARSAPAIEPAKPAEKTPTSEPETATSEPTPTPAKPATSTTDETSTSTSTCEKAE